MTGDPADLAVEYTVTATLPTPEVLEEYVAWLGGGHARAVVSAGARSARVARLLEPPWPLRVEARYLFASLAQYEDYQTHRASTLRAEGVRLFAGRGVTFERRLGRIEYAKDLGSSRL